MPTMLPSPTLSSSSPRRAIMMCSMNTSSSLWEWRRARITPPSGPLVQPSARVGRGRASTSPPASKNTQVLLIWQAFRPHAWDRCLGSSFGRTAPDRSGVEAEMLSLPETIWCVSIYRALTTIGSYLTGSMGEGDSQPLSYPLVSL
jgi:hypothetical protein